MEEEDDELRNELDIMLFNKNNFDILKQRLVEIEQTLPEKLNEWKNYREAIAGNFLKDVRREPASETLNIQKYYFYDDEMVKDAAKLGKEIAIERSEADFLRKVIGFKEYYTNNPRVENKKNLDRDHPIYKNFLLPKMKEHLRYVKSLDNSKKFVKDILPDSENHIYDARSYDRAMNYLRYRDLNLRPRRDLSSEEYKRLKLLKAYYKQTKMKKKFRAEDNAAYDYFDRLQLLAEENEEDEEDDFDLYDPHEDEIILQNNRRRQLEEAEAHAAEERNVRQRLEGLLHEEENDGWVDAEAVRNNHRLVRNALAEEGNSGLAGSNILNDVNDADTISIPSQDEYDL
jgi:hypothetical protein